MLTRSFARQDIRSLRRLDRLSGVYPQESKTNLFTSYHQLKTNIVIHCDKSENSLSDTCTQRNLAFATSAAGQLKFSEQVLNIFYSGRFD